MKENITPPMMVAPAPRMSDWPTDGPGGLSGGSEGVLMVVATPCRRTAIPKLLSEPGTQAGGGGVASPPHRDCRRRGSLAHWAAIPIIGEKGGRRWASLVSTGTRRWTG